MGAPTKTLDVFIERDADTVYRYVSYPENLPRWAAGLCQSVERRGAAWIMHTPAGPMELAFAATNTLGVLDHLVTMPSGGEVLNPMRVIPNGSGSTVLFTLLQRPGMTDAQFDVDASMVRRDLDVLKTLLEA